MTCVGIRDGGIPGSTAEQVRVHLTVLGIAIGMAAVICVVAIGEDQVQRQMSNLGGN